jgi:hypothetical protein
MPMVRGSVVRSARAIRLMRRLQPPPSGLFRLLLGAARIPLMLAEPCLGLGEPASGHVHRLVDPEDNLDTSSARPHPEGRGPITLARTRIESAARAG